MFAEEFLECGWGALFQGVNSLDQAEFQPHRIRHVPPQQVAFKVEQLEDELFEEGFGKPGLLDAFGHRWNHLV